MLRLEKLYAVLASAYRAEEYPALRRLREIWADTRPLAGLRVIVAAPIFRNTLAQHLAIVAAGAEIVVGIGAGAQYDADIVNLIEEAGIRLARVDDGNVPDADIILDNAGYFAAFSPRIGFAELTRTGAEKYRDCNKPVFLADAGKIKKIETFLGTGESFFRAMAALGHRDWRGKKLVVAGSGKVGSGIIFYAHKFGAEVVCITDPATLTEKTRQRVSQVVDYRDDAGIIFAVRDAFAVVTATGKKDALARAEVSAALTRSPALLANMGVEDEYGTGVPTERVLEKKRSLNFFLDDPTHMKFIEGTLALHAAGAVFLAEHAGSLPRGIFAPPPEIEDAILRITRERGCISEELKSIE
ncbi:MAG: adenosylhomocysteinase [Opitutae bacterium]|nr:adenosylhomocysteinase [Opitutae bacterium]